MLSYNICMGGEDRLPTIAAVIRAEKPDAVALLEATDRERAAALANELGLAFAFGEANCPAHIAWLSRGPILGVSNHRHAGLGKTLLTIEIDWAGEPLHLCATHLASRHEPPDPADEIPLILDLLAPLSDRPHLLAGDFNALRPGDPIGDLPPGVAARGDAIDGAPRRAIGRLLDAGFVDCFRTLHPYTPGYTYPTDHPWLRLDYIFASPSLAPRLRACELICDATTERASDHLPVWATFD